jgi:SpoVK/Ycf46/Vps4 family AAA+-type ATPase
MYFLLSIELIVATAITLAISYLLFRKWERLDLSGSSSEKNISDILNFLQQKDEEGKLSALSRRGNIPVNGFYTGDSIGWINTTSERGQTTYHIWCARKKIPPKVVKLEESEKIITKWSYIGGLLFEMQWDSDEAPLSKPITKSQEDIVNNILHFQDHSMKNNFPYGGIFHIRGKPGTGKTTMSLSLASKMLENDSIKSVSVAKYNPLLPGNSWEKMVKKIRPSSEKPLIVVMDEADKIFQQCINGKKDEIYKYFLVQCFNKESLNDWLDAVMNTPNVILLLTMNIKLEDTDIDPSVFRPGRRVKMYDLEEECAQKVIESRFGKLEDN